MITDAGMYLQGSVHGTGVKFLIDTGATVTMIAKGVYERMAPEDRPWLYEVTGNVLCADGKPLEVVGKGNLPCHSGEKCQEHCVIVAKIGLTVEGVLGLDFLEEVGSEIDFVNHSLKIGDAVLSYEVIKSISMECARVVLSETMTIPARHEMNVPCKLQTVGNGHSYGSTGIVEPEERFVENKQLLVGKVLISATSDNVIPLRVMNVTDETKVVHAGTIMGRYIPVDDDDVDDVSGESLAQVKTIQMPEHLKKLSQETKKGLTSAQRKKVDQLLRTFSGLFANSKDDLGRTNQIRHKINTGDERPVKQPLRRIPIHSRDEIEDHVESMLTQGIIEPSLSPWASPIVLVRKKDGTTRFCVDYRAVNQLTVKDAYPLPRIDDSLDRLSGVSWFSTLDLMSGYW